MQEVNGRKVIVEISETENVSFEVLIEFLAKGFMEHQAKSKENTEEKGETT